MELNQQIVTQNQNTICTSRELIWENFIGLYANEFLGILDDMDALEINILWRHRNQGILIEFITIEWNFTFKSLDMHLNSMFRKTLHTSLILDEIS